MSSDTLFALFAILIALVVVGALITGVVLMVRDTKRQRGVFGINTSAPVCARCDSPAPMVRAPANFRQFLWGGWTCQRCSLELDKWGRPIAGQDFPPSLPDVTGRAPRAADGERYKKPSDDVQRGGEIRG
jgi:hypothetical protein